LIQLGTVSHRSSLPILHSHLARANAPEEPVNFASAVPPFGVFLLANSTFYFESRQSRPHRVDPQ
jgi:hypothetical protein